MRGGESAEAPLHIASLLPPSGCLHARGGVLLSGGGRAPSSKPLSRAALTSVPQPLTVGGGGWRHQPGRQAIEEEEVRAKLGHPVAYPGLWPADAPPGPAQSPSQGSWGLRELVRRAGAPTAARTRLHLVSDHPWGVRDRWMNRNRAAVRPAVGGGLRGSRQPSYSFPPPSSQPAS